MTDNITNIHHSSLLVADTQTSLQFYTEVLGLKQIERPNLPFPGAWMAVGNPDHTTGRPAHGGRDRHIAFNIINLDQLKHNLESHQVPYTLSISGRKALFCRDPDGNALEFIEQQ
jgi:glyoxylase I family protein